MQTMDMSLRRLLDAKKISGDVAFQAARNKKIFEQYRSDPDKRELETSVF